MFDETKEWLEGHYSLNGKVCTWTGPAQFQISRAKVVQGDNQFIFKLTPEQYEAVGVDIVVLNRYDPRRPALNKEQFATGEYEYDGVTIIRE